MMVRFGIRTQFSSCALVVALSTGASCSDGAARPSWAVDGGYGTGGSGTAAIDGSVASAGASAAPHLNDTHPGWRIPLCLSCHGQTAPLPHLAEAHRPPDCVACHGYNGAPHRNHAVLENPACADCHNTVSHVPSFTPPDDCVRCHYHPENPTGQ